MMYKPPSVRPTRMAGGGRVGRAPLTSFQQLRAMVKQDGEKRRKLASQSPPPRAKAVDTKPTPDHPSLTMGTGQSSSQSSISKFCSPTMSPRLTEEQRRQRGIHPT